ncbi:protein FAR1-RELATED SEQUENCE 5-like [Chenopodium quinoa]|uniref:protein FAR1-RELATED SEQUENCE 5-like n=1 Tax=Chenopodium quinoa TaxID=63459 RepID=UPI000B77BF99|nr:protein FAR1-RELATED SEQUENCE 5-like [Chenopodium quinoa]
MEISSSIVFDRDCDSSLIAFDRDCDSIFPAGVVEKKNAILFEEAASSEFYGKQFPSEDVASEFFAKRQIDEADFYYDFEQDENGALVNFFWRYGRMMRDYHYFGDLLVFDTTYRTNKYGMICAPFVGMNHHANNVMFGMGFILNERTESFEWLFDTFLTSMGRRSPITIMTDQAQAIAAGIRNIFPKGVHHRLCVWHIEQNSKKHIGALRALDGFTDLFGYLLKYCETPPEFEHYWKRMLLKYDCANVDWLNHLYKIKEMWCPAFQRNFEWRSKEKGRDYNTIRGNRHLAFAYIGILIHARSLYTIQAYVLFEEEFIKGTACDQKDAGVNFPEYYYHLWRPGKDMIKHEMTIYVRGGLRLLCVVMALMNLQ